MSIISLLVPLNNEIIKDTAAYLGWKAHILKTILISGSIIGLGYFVLKQTINSIFGPLNFILNLFQRNQDFHTYRAHSFHPNSQNTSAAKASSAFISIEPSEITETDDQTITPNLPVIPESSKVQPNEEPTPWA